MIAEINYRKNRVSEIVDEGMYKDVKWLIVDRGWFPCAYVENIVNAKDFFDDLLCNIDVHGGFTFCGEDLEEAEGINLLGWDYGHAGDYCGYDNIILEAKQWTYEEIQEDVYNVIDQLKELKSGNNL